MTMNEGIEKRIRALAQPLWESSARPYGVAFEFWLMAEQMVLEAAAAMNRMQSLDLPEDAACSGMLDIPSEMPVDRVRGLAECMWESAGRQRGVAQDYWLAAERHVQAILRAVAASSNDPFAREAVNLPPWEYLQRIREAAYEAWDAAGQHYGRALEYWVDAEQQVLEHLRTAAANQADAFAVAPPPENQESADQPETVEIAAATPASGVDTRVETAIPAPAMASSPDIKEGPGNKPEPTAKPRRTKPTTPRRPARTPRKPQS